MEFQGFVRDNGEIGIRNFLAVLPSVYCANKVAEEIAIRIGKPAVALPHTVGCGQVGVDFEQTAITLKNIGKHPNVGAVLVVGLGCERFQPYELVENISASGKPVEMVVIQKAGGSRKAIRTGLASARKLADKISGIRRQTVPAAALTLGMKCGGTDATSGIAANPTVGYVSDQIIEEGGGCIFTEITEIMGAEHILVRRAASEAIGRNIMEVVDRWEKILIEEGRDERFSNRGALISVGNMDGGVSTLVEKALGNILKSGSKKIDGVLKYSERPSKKGLYLMDAHGYDGESVTGMVAAGAQIVLFTTGRGTPTGFPIAPVIKITGNSKTFQKMKDNLDFNAGGIVDGLQTIEECGALLMKDTLAVASGRLTKAEELGHQELFIVSRNHPRQ